MKKKFLLIIIVICILMGILASNNIYYYLNLSPYEVLVNKYKNESSTVKPKSLVDQIEEGNQILVFYYNENGNFACATMQRNFFSYSILNCSAELSLPENNKPASIMFSSFRLNSYTKKSQWINWGIIDNSVAKVLINEEAAAIIECDSLRFYYDIGTGNEVPTELIYQFYNDNGEIVYQIP